jgi:hypothetical protein
MLADDCVATCGEYKYGTDDFTCEDCGASCYECVDADICSVC